MQPWPQAPCLKPEGSWQTGAPTTASLNDFDFSALNTAHTDFFDWTVSLDGQELGVDVAQPRGGSAGTDRRAFSSAHKQPARYWADTDTAASHHSHEAFEQQASTSDSSRSTAEQATSGGDTINVETFEPLRSSILRASIDRQPPSPQLLSDALFPSARAQIDQPEVSKKTPAAPAATGGTARTEGADRPRPAPRRVQFRDMTQASRQWARFEADASSNSVSPGSMIKTDSMDESQRYQLNVDANGSKTSILRSRQMDAFNDGKAGLPAEKGFPIQIGSELFRLSGASLMSDAPSYFSKFFEEQLKNNDEGSTTVKTLYIDRDPITFQDIALHLQGYSVLPRDGYHYVKLFADAQFYGLPKLIKQLFESEYFIRIGEQDFRIAKDLFSSPGNTPNFFSLGLGFAIFTPTNGDVFPGLSGEGLFRPPSIEAPAILNRSASTFADLLHLLRGYPLEIRSQEHRTSLLRDCRYYHFRGLEQQLIHHSISYNVARQKTEMVIRLEDIRQSGVSFVGDATPADRSPLAGWVNYARPFVDENPCELVVELGDESTRLSVRTMRAEFFGQTKARITSLFQVVANKMNLPTNAPLGLMMSTGGVATQPVSPGNTPLSDDLVKVAIERDAYLLLDGEEYDTANLPASAHSGGDGMTDVSTASTYSEGGGNQHLHPLGRNPSAAQPSRKRARRGSLDEFGEWIIRKGQWRLRVQPRSDQDNHNGPAMEIVMMAVKLDAISGQRGRNGARGFLN